MTRALLNRLIRILAATAVAIGPGIAAAPGTAAAPGPGEPRVRVLVSQEVEAYNEAVEGLRRVLDRDSAGTAVEVVGLRGEAAATAAAVAKAKQDNVSVLVTLGSLATSQAVREVRELPIVAGMILDAGDIHGASNATGVFLEFPVETELKWIQKILPDRRSVGVLFSPAGSSERIQAAEKAAPAVGLKLLSRRVESPRDLPSSLDSLAGSADVLWGVTDPVVLTPQTAKPILLFSLRNRVPFVGLSLNWVKAGALYALDRDYQDIGAQCGELVVQILKGRSPSALPPVPPRKVVYAINLKTARALKIDIEKALLERAHDVIE